MWTTESTPSFPMPRGLLNRLLERITESGPWGPVLAALTFVALVLLGAAILWWFAGGPVMKALAARVGAPAESLRPLRTGLRLLVSLGAVSTLVGHFTDVDLFTVLAGAATLVAVGFVALWSTLANITCTVLILITRPFRIGDEVAFPPDPIEGQVVDLSFFFTTLKTKDGRFINVPNTTFFQRIVIRRETNVALDLGEQLAKPEAAKLEAPAETVSP
ncbi:MAG: mechanosensitive ion channel [Myxococcaceae bacterium]|nr:mechanosensitive ion channel [Myxococcaceae bacterium]